ncbi:ERG2 and sigma1 receptor-like protein [Setomelanomma holmii]|uniref:C-8 sterol isomerase n=1 Tax=Setomelanomma holmii TaxID=210430 RepID=A0A9P4LPA8_9PLEO|nr:ERG2 and sigma1 receptor-like protein [Setomelanomma holmii]
MQLLTFLSIPVLLLSIPIYYLTFSPEIFFVFDPEALHNLTLPAIRAHGNNTAAIVSSIVSSLSTTHPVHVNLDEEWVFNNAGGAMGAMYIIHASLTEYLVIFGTALGTEGHSGRHTANDYFMILVGEELAYAPVGKGIYEPERYPPGTVNLMRRGQVKQYKMEEKCFALEYARGWIPGMLAFGFADTFTSTLDFYTLWRTVWITGREMVGNLMIGKI